MLAEPRTLSRGSDRRLYTVAALVALVVVFAGFAQTYFMKGLFGTPVLPGLLHLHGALMTLWFVLFLTQVRLVAARRVDLHRRLGIAGAVLAASILVVGVTTAINGARLGHSPGPPPLVFLVVPLGDMLVFGTLVATALYFRHRRDIHRRLMLLACVGILTAAIARIPLAFVHSGGVLVAFLLMSLGVIACVIFDSVKNRRLHPAFGWGALCVIASWPLRLLLAGTPAWNHFATWLTA